jgi:hypothetical protein
MFLSFLVDDLLLKKEAYKFYLDKKIIKIKIENSKQKEIIIKQKS